VCSLPDADRGRHRQAGSRRVGIRDRTDIPGAFRRAKPMLLTAVSEPRTPRLGAQPPGRPLPLSLKIPTPIDRRPRSQPNASLVWHPKAQLPGPVRGRPGSRRAAKRVALCLSRSCAAPSVWTRPPRPPEPDVPADAPPSQATQLPSQTPRASPRLPHGLHLPSSRRDESGGTQLHPADAPPSRLACDPDVVPPSKCRL
jgi:hypothetical protein